MVYIDETRIIQDALTVHRKKLQRKEWEEASKEKRSNGVPTEIEIVAQQITDNESSFYDDTDESVIDFQNKLFEGIGVIDLPTEHEEGCRCPDCVSSAIDAAEGEGY